MSALVQQATYALQDLDAMLVRDIRECSSLSEIAATRIALLNVVGLVNTRMTQLYQRELAIMEAESHV